MYYSRKGSQAAKAQRFKAVNKVSPEFGKKALLNLEASRQLSEQFGLSKDQVYKVYKDQEMQQNTDNSTINLKFGITNPN